jgi:membrane protein YdbS with pleckstrin-like domain
VGYIDETLTPGEEVLHRTRLHWVAVFWPYLLAALFGIAAIAGVIAALASRGEPGNGIGRTPLLILSAVAAVAAAMAFASGAIRRAGIEMAVTNKRLIVKTGVLRRHTIEMVLTKIESVSVDQGVLGRLANYGTVLVRGSGGTVERFDRVADPLAFRRKAQEQIERSQGLHGAGRAPGPAALAFSSAPPAHTGDPRDYAPPGSSPAQRFCGQCGQALPPEVEYCPRCGVRRMR